MLSKSKEKFIRMSWRKIGLVTDLVKGKTVEEANSILDNLSKRAALPVKKAVGSAFANLNSARQDKFLEKDVYISKITADDGPMFVRYRAATMGRAAVIRHRTAHICVELDKIKTNSKSEYRNSKQIQSTKS